MSAATGQFDARGVHRFAARAYFEDTDLTGVVYHANYLRYMERARSDMLVLCGIDQLALLGAAQGYFAVADLSIAYKRPARLGDDLTVVSWVTRVRAAATVMTQQVRRGDEVLTDAAVTACWLDAQGRPQRQPREWAQRFEQLRQSAETEN
ncbi:YbgC/FadM family acyl-CoA thioesterase [Glacieibacterium frigidum]|uniref:YbgC/FadM family acyl-CoA thioesterase n=1 Tax=Glacieibacterium frigidum TaxID=2593303 RepID=A0A552UGD2_9SPHN|nr:YbgC/FadM family acyl-CoA thioesterase [Glacieibacterium frigidum]TRW17280.1 YbgC/FadM family acyl-CoA thioesterase [Glacieibacterium frigidum]